MYLCGKHSDCKTPSSCRQQQQVGGFPLQAGLAQILAMPMPAFSMPQQNLNAAQALAVLSAAAGVPSVRANCIGIAAMFSVHSCASMRSRAPNTLIERTLPCTLLHAHGTALPLTFVLTSRCTGTEHFPLNPCSATSTGSKWARLSTGRRVGRGIRGHGRAGRNRV